MTDYDRVMWLAIRAALIMFIRAIEIRYGLEERKFSNHEEVASQKPLATTYSTRV